MPKSLERLVQLHEAQQAPLGRFRKPSLQTLAHMENIEAPVYAPTTHSAIELFQRLNSNTTILFLVNGEKLGVFKFERNMQEQRVYFTCFSKTDNGPCIQISITALEVHLDDYFYSANLFGYDCEKNSWEKHKMILNTLLEFLAYAFEKKQISLQDAASRKYTHCPALFTGIHLVAGLKSFYERAAGFMNKTATSVADQVGALPAPPHLAQRGTTLRECARTIIQMCKEEREPISETDDMLINYIQKTFHKYLAAHEYFLDYKKITMNMYGCDVKQGDNIINDRLVNAQTLEPGDRIKPFLSFDIITP